MARYVLSQRAADWMRAQMNAGYVGEADSARLRARDGSLPIDPPQHFALARRVTSGVAIWEVGEGAVQDGAETVWFDGGTVQPNAIGESIVYAQLNTTSKVVTVGVVSDTSALAALQQTTGVVVWPLYHMTDAVIDMDYRPIFSVGGGAAPDEISVDKEGVKPSTDPDAQPTRGLLQIKGWASVDAVASQTLAEMMAPSDGSTEPYQVVARYDGAGGELRYIPIGRLAGVVLPDVNAVVGVSFAFNAAGQLEATLAKTNLKTGEASTSKELVPLWRQDVDAASAYSTGDHKFTKVVMPSVRTAETAPTTTTDVFTATPHSAEMDS